jgi:hypothetical protein
MQPGFTNARPQSLTLAVHKRDHSAAAFRLLAAIDSYADAFETRLLRHDADSHQRLAAAYGNVRTTALVLPDLAVPWVALMISHAELLAAMWPATSEAVQARSMAAHDRHTKAVEDLREHCLQHLSSRE